MQDFWDAMDECRFADLGFEGNKFTWCKSIMGGVKVWERLDRALENDECVSLF